MKHLIPVIATALLLVGCDYFRSDDVPEGGCIATSDGTAILVSEPGVQQPKGKELARIHNKELVALFPDSLTTDAAHLRACRAWRTDFAAKNLKSGRVNNDDHRQQPAL